MARAGWRLFGLRPTLQMTLMSKLATVTTGPVVPEMSTQLGQVPPAALTATPASPGLPPRALAPGAPDPAPFPNRTFGLVLRKYDVLRSLGAALESEILDNVDLSGLWQSLGYDLESAINTALGTMLTQTCPASRSMSAASPCWVRFLSGRRLHQRGGTLGLIGFNLADPLNLARAPTPGLNIISAG